jgi:hypothetical protein
MSWYKTIPTVLEILERAKILIKSVVWGAMNVPYPVSPHIHIDQVIFNVFVIYNKFVYADLRTEMIMTNHSVQVLQRNWRRCISDPTHIVCRRRLEYEFQNMV